MKNLKGGFRVDNKCSGAKAQITLDEKNSCRSEATYLELAKKT